MCTKPIPSVGPFKGGTLSMQVAGGANQKKVVMPPQKQQPIAVLKLSPLPIEKWPSFPLSAPQLVDACLSKWLWTICFNQRQQSVDTDEGSTVPQDCWSETATLQCRIPSFALNPPSLLCSMQHLFMVFISYMLEMIIPSKHEYSQYSWCLCWEKHASSAALHFCFVILSTEFLFLCDLVTIIQFCKAFFSSVVLVEQSEMASELTKQQATAQRGHLWAQEVLMWSTSGMICPCSTSSSASLCPPQEEI